MVRVPAVQGLSGEADDDKADHADTERDPTVGSVEAQGGDHRHDDTDFHNDLMLFSDHEVFNPRCVVHPGLASHHFFENDGQRHGGAALASIGRPADGGLTGIVGSSDESGHWVTRPIYQVKAEFFKTLGHPARIRILELLRDQERSVGELIPLVGLEPSHLSQQLAILRRANIVQSRKDGSMVLYSVSDAQIFKLLEVAKAILSTSLAETRDLLTELQTLDFADAPKRRRRA